MKLSVILPTYNERDNIIDLIETIKKFIPEGYTHEILIIDDNSPDKTFEIVKSKYENDLSVIPTLRKNNKGLAYSVKDGVLLASGDLILVMDTDFTHNPNEISKMLHLVKIFDFVSGSRFAPGGNMQDRSHYLSSLIYNWFVRILIRTQIQDNLGGYWLTHRYKLLSLPIDKIFIGYGDYFIRLLHYVQHSKLTIIEFPTVYLSRKHGKSKSNFFKMIFSYTYSILKLKRELNEKK